MKYVLPHKSHKSHESLSFDDYFDMVYYINLDRRPDRNENILKIFNELNINNYRRIEAIDGSAIEKEIKSLKYIVNNWLDKFKLHKTLMVRAWACKQSHMMCLNDALNNGYNCICIFEDDIKTRQNAHIDLNICFDWMSNNNWDLFYFDNVNCHRDVGKQVREIKGKVNAHSYCLNKALIIKKLYNEHCRQINTRNDHVLKNIRLKKFCYGDSVFLQNKRYTTDNDKPHTVFRI